MRLSLVFLDYILALFALRVGEIRYHAANTDGGAGRSAFNAASRTALKYGFPSLGSSLWPHIRGFPRCEEARDTGKSAMNWTTCACRRRLREAAVEGEAEIERLSPTTRAAFTSA